MESFITSPGSSLPFGTSLKKEGVNFSLFSRHAEKVTLLLFRSGSGPVVAEFALDPGIHRTGDVWHILVHDLDPEMRYGYRVAGPWDPEGEGHRFNGKKLLLDPFARALTGSSVWGEAYFRRGESPGPKYSSTRRCCLVADDFNWEGDRPLKIPLKDSIIYEMHVRGYTCHASSATKHPGTYLGIVEKIPYLKKLGVTAVELLPVTEFNENETINRNPETGVRLKNFWGYSPIAFFAPKASYAVNSHNGKQVNEFKEMVKALHRAGIEVILDIVFNHTAEGGADGPVISFRGLDNSIYYMLDPVSREYMNFSGCGNTLNCNHPLLRNLIMDCLRYWVTEMHVDGFRFDLASVLGRDFRGEVMENPPMVEQIAEDPILANIKIIAEAWDAAGLYQVGSFSSHPRWAEWNGRYRDDVRAFVAGHENTVAALATRISGSADLYQLDRAPFNSINFITSHDGFTLYDLVSYEQKHNEMNGENNRDGTNDNRSWNSGAEGEVADVKINRLRRRRIRTAAVLLFLSQGTPMMLAGDEFGRTQKGNNNAYCQDNEISWIDWNLAKKNKGLLRFFRLLIKLRKAHPVFRRAEFFPDDREAPLQEISWQAEAPGETDWSAECRILCFRLDGRAVQKGKRDNDFFVMLNGGREMESVVPPKPARGSRWHLLLDTAAVSPRDVFEENEAPLFAGKKFQLAAMAAAVLISKPKSGGQPGADG